ncbi:hypothetical protein J3E74DRAFT_13574 [Bipolaris maydis]|nr:hypothetical protein J3E74DRAFT_13574 [Bipolaris maydis]KAJ6283684.1 hypothetical protein J3E71DRAFT_30714 [Bipolaris maydis]
MFATHWAYCHLCIVLLGSTDNAQRAHSVVYLLLHGMIRRVIGLRLSHTWRKLKIWGYDQCKACKPSISMLLRVPFSSDVV